MNIKERKNLIKLERIALSCVRRKRWLKAAKLFSQIIAKCPDWAHGNSQYSLACCYEELGRLDDARQWYINALKIEPGNPYFLGGYTSFLYLHGDPSEAYNYYMALIRAEGCTDEVIKQCAPALKVLADKSGLSHETLEQDLIKLKVK